MNNKTSLQTIYDQVIQHYSWENYEEAKKRLLRKKYSFLLKNLVLCNPEDFKEKGANFVPANDAPIIRELLVEAVNDSEESMVVDWFNGNVDTSDSLTATLLYMQLKPVIMNPYIMGETDEVTMDEWLRTVSAAINHSTARNTLSLKRSLENFRNSSLPLDATIGYGDIITTHEDGSRSFGMRGDRDKDILGEFWNAVSIAKVHTEMSLILIDTANYRVLDEIWVPGDYNPMTNISVFRVPAPVEEDVYEDTDEFYEEDPRGAFITKSHRPKGRVQAVMETPLTKCAHFRPEVYSRDVIYCFALRPNRSERTKQWKKEKRNSQQTITARKSDQVR